MGEENERGGWGRSGKVKSSAREICRKDRSAYVRFKTEKKDGAWHYACGIWIYRRRASSGEIGTTAEIFRRTGRTYTCKRIWADLPDRHGVVWQVFGTVRRRADYAERILRASWRRIWRGESGSDSSEHWPGCDRRRRAYKNERYPRLVFCRSERCAFAGQCGNGRHFVWAGQRKIQRERYLVVARTEGKNLYTEILFIYGADKTDGTSKPVMVKGVGGGKISASGVFDTGASQAVSESVRCRWRKQKA